MAENETKQKSQGFVDNAFSGGSSYSPLQTAGVMDDIDINNRSLTRVPQSEESLKADLQSFLNEAGNIRNTEDLKVLLEKYKGLDYQAAMTMAAKQPVERFETRAEQREHDEKEARMLSGALLGGIGATVDAGMVMGGGGGMRASLFTGGDEKYKQGPSAILPPSAPHAIQQADLAGGVLSRHVDNFESLVQGGSSPSLGIPGKVQQKGFNPDFT